MLNTRMRISVLGAGAWGTALASHAAQSHDVVLWGRDANLVAQMAATHINATYLPGMTLQASLHFSADLQAALDHAAGHDGLAVIASPVAGLADLARTIAAHGGVRNVIWLCKGFDPETSALPHAIVADVLKASGRTDLAVGVLSGPSFAKEVAQGLPCAMTVASTSQALCKLTQRGFHHHAMRVYASDDLVGVEVGEDGVVSAIFDNSEIRKIAMIGLATFPNPDGLKAVSGNAYRPTIQSGEFAVKQPGLGGDAAPPKSRASRSGQPPLARSVFGRSD